MQQRRRNKPPHHEAPRWGFFVRFLSSAARDVFRPVQQVSAPDPVVDPKKLQVWMVGHATILINLYGTTILTDPVFGNWLPFPKRIVGPGLRLEQLPPIDIILQSHTHWDHFHIPSVRKVASANTTLVIAKNCADLAKRMTFKDVVELAAGDVHTESELTITTYQPHHWGRRLPWEKQQRGFNAYVIEKNGTTIFFSGDTGYGSMFEEVGRQHDVDIALLPIGAYKPDSIRKVHMNPEDALMAKADLGADTMIPFHFGTFRLSLEPLHEPVEWLQRLAKERAEERIAILHSGDTYEHR